MDYLSPVSPLNKKPTSSTSPNKIHQPSTKLNRPKRLTTENKTHNLGLSASDLLKEGVNRPRYLQEKERDRKKCLDSSIQSSQGFEATCQNKEGEQEGEKKGRKCIVLLMKTFIKCLLSLPFTVGVLGLIVWYVLVLVLGLAVVLVMGMSIVSAHLITYKDKCVLKCMGCIFLPVVMVIGIVSCLFGAYPEYVLECGGWMMMKIKLLFEKMFSW